MDNEKRVCLECGLELVQRNHESHNRFMKKRFDSAACGRAYLKRNKIGWFSESSRNSIFGIRKENDEGGESK